MEFSPNWDEKERKMDEQWRRKHRHYRRRRRIVMKCYLGYGHWVMHWNDGTQELVSDGQEACQFFYRIGHWTEDGFPDMEGKE